MRFLHAADIHLGYSQYGSEQRYNDFGRAYMAMARAAIAAKVDFVLLAGDLFHERDLEPRTLLQAAMGLSELAQVHIPVLAVEGNHERPHWHDDFSWVDYLAQMGLLINLSPWDQDGELVVAPWDEKTHRGAYYDLPGGVRVYGCRYYGASTARMIEMLASVLTHGADRPAYSIVMLHAGVENVLPKLAGLTHAELAPLRPLMDYVALGHIHKPFVHDDWLYNPGSLETNSVQEADWPERGYFLVDVDLAQRRHRAELVRGTRRSFVRLRFDVTPHRTPAELQEAASRFLSSSAQDCPTNEPVVELTLTGSLAFTPAELPLDALRTCAQTAYGALLVRIQDLSSPPGWEVSATETASRVDVERQVLRQLIERDERYRAASEEWTSVVLRLKEMVLQRAPAESVIAQVYEDAARLYGETN
ncbi:MAG: exonuclease SbcCD subunit D [Anaerolineales bacterium]